MNKLNDENIKLLEALYKNIEMGVQSIEDIIEEIKDQKLKSEISKELDTYSVLKKECEMLAKSEKVELSGTNAFAKSMLWCSVKMKTMMDKSPQHLSEMLIQGSQMGIIDIIKEKAKCKNIMKELSEIAGKLENFQEESIQRLKPFLMCTNKS